MTGFADYVNNKMDYYVYMKTLSGDTLFLTINNDWTDSKHVPGDTIRRFESWMTARAAVWYLKTYSRKYLSERSLLHITSAARHVNILENL